MQVEKKIQPDKHLPTHEAEPELCAPIGSANASFFFSLDGTHQDEEAAFISPHRIVPKRHFLKFTEDECRRWAYLFEQAADRMAGYVVSQSDDGYVINTALNGKSKAGQREGAQP